MPDAPGSQNNTMLSIGMHNNIKFKYIGTNVIYTFMGMRMPIFVISYFRENELICNVLSILHKKCCDLMKHVLIVIFVNFITLTKLQCTKKPVVNIYSSYGVFIRSHT